MDLERTMTEELRVVAMKDLRRALRWPMAVVFSQVPLEHPDDHVGVRLYATSRPAEYLGLRDLGTLTPGRAASFIVLDANPLDDITNTRRIADVYIDGRRVDRQAMLARLSAVR